MVENENNIKIELPIGYYSILAPRIEYLMDASLKIKKHQLYIEKKSILPPLFLIRNLTARS
jgi:hypothetical protein